jgi:hypothetical protein
MYSNDLSMNAAILLSNETSEKQTQDEVSNDKQGQGQNNEVEQVHIHEFDNKLDVIKLPSIYQNTFLFVLTSTLYF